MSARGKSRMRVRARKVVEMKKREVCECEMREKLMGGKLRGDE